MSTDTDSATEKDSPETPTRRGGIETNGINVIAGTGSMTYGRRAGRGVRVGGWGELYGDEGSAYWIAVRGLAAFTRMSDGRAPVGPLHEVLREHLALPTDHDLVDVVLGRWKGDRARIAALAPVVVAAADLGDAACRAVLADAAGELAALVATTAARLGFPDGASVPVSWSGGVFAAPAVLNLLDVRDERVRGFAIGMSSHGIGTSRAFHESPLTGAFAGLAMALNALATAVALPVLLAVAPWLLHP